VKSETQETRLDEVLGTRLGELRGQTWEMRLVKWFALGGTVVLGEVVRPPSCGWEKCKKKLE
jgi:hypothetical protein